MAVWSPMECSPTDRPGELLPAALSRLLSGPKAFSM
uniref:Uncharacterized protein n=1 Tax=Arundo donax TaxID=35708 RepID=A0A0A8YVE1_ARUDO